MVQFKHFLNRSTVCPPKCIKVQYNIAELPPLKRCVCVSVDVFAILFLIVTVLLKYK